MPGFHNASAPAKHGTEFATSPPPQPHNERSCRDFPPRFPGLWHPTTFLVSARYSSAHPFVGCPASTCPATRHIADGECEGDEEDGSGLVGSSNGSVSILGNVGSDVFIPPTLPPSSSASYKPLCQQHAAIRHQLSCQRLVADPPQICMNAAIALSIIPTLAPASEGAPYVGAHDLYQWTRVWMIQWMTDWLDAPTQP